MNRIDEINREITEERLREGWSFALSNTKEYAAGNSEINKLMTVRFSKNNQRFIVDYIELFNNDKVTTGLISPEYSSCMDFIEAMNDARNLELHEMNRNY